MRSEWLHIKEEGRSAVADEFTVMRLPWLARPSPSRLGAATQTVYDAAERGDRWAQSQTAGRSCTVGCGTASFGADETCRGAADWLTGICRASARGLKPASPALWPLHTTSHHSLTTTRRPRHIRYPHPRRPRALHCASHWPRTTGTFWHRHKED
jgi:hypothetical protein